MGLSSQMSEVIIALFLLDHSLREIHVDNFRLLRFTWTTIEFFNWLFFRVHGCLLLFSLVYGIWGWLFVKWQQRCSTEVRGLHHSGVVTEYFRLPLSGVNLGFIWCQVVLNSFTSQGMPTHDSSGKELAKSQLKKLQKLYDAQAKRYAAYLKSTGIT